MLTILLSVFLGVFGCIAIYLYSEIDYDPKSDKHFNVFPYRKFFLVPLLLPIVAVVSESFTIVSAGHVGVQTTMGSVNMEVFREGVHFVNPISQVREVEVRVVKATLEKSQAGTKDLQVVHTDVVVNYRIDGTKAPHIYKEFGLDLQDKILMPAMNEAFKAVTAHYNSEELITKRDAVSNAINEELQAKVLQYGLTISSISLVNFGFSTEYQNAIEQKVISTQATLKAEQDLKRIQVEAQQNIAKAEGEAKAIAIQAQAINASGGAEYVHLKAIQKWDGKLPTTMSGVVPFINIGGK